MKLKFSIPFYVQLFLFQTDVHCLGSSELFTVTTVWNTGETGDIYWPIFIVLQWGLNIEYIQILDGRPHLWFPLVPSSNGLHKMASKIDQA